MELIRDNNGLINVTVVLQKYNKENKSNKRFKDFFENSATKNAVALISERRDIKTVYVSKVGRNGSSWFHDDLYAFFNNWLYKLPNKTFGRDEHEFCAAIETAFDGVLKFERQKVFDLFKVDLYCKQINLCIEFDELHHSSQINEDKERENKIKKENGVEFLRCSKKDNLFEVINKIIKKKDG